MADYLPDPPAPPARPRPRQQNNPQTDTLVQQPQATEPDTEPLESAPEIAPVDPHTLRAGTTVVPVPDWIDTKTHDKVQAYLNYAEWQIAAGYDALGFPREESDRRASSTLTGGILTGVVGAEVLSVPAAGIGCGVGAVLGGVTGGILGTAAAGVGLPFGAGLGAGLGCLAGIAVAAVPAIAVGATAGAVLGGAVAGTLGGGVDVVKPDVPPLIDTAAVEPRPPEPEPAQAKPPTTADMVTTAVQQSIETLAPAVKPAITSLHDALDNLPVLDPVTFGPFTAPITDFVDAVRAGL
ncbi:hypothetical protein [Nocardia tengchongensis]